MGKDCSTCFERKPLDAFYKHSKGYDGRMSKCKECHKAAVKLRSRTNPAVQEYDRQRAKKPHRRKAARKNVVNWRNKFPDKYAALTAVGNAVRDGKLTRGRTCACGSTKNVFGIHPDPAKPLDVVWRCALCHHRSRFEAQPADERATA